MNYFVLILMGYIDLLSYDGFHIIVHIKLKVKLNCQGNCSFGKGAFLRGPPAWLADTRSKGKEEPTAQGCSPTSICALWHMNAHKRNNGKELLTRGKTGPTG